MRHKYITRGALSEKWQHLNQVNWISSANASIFVAIDFAIVANDASSLSSGRKAIYCYTNKYSAVASGIRYRQELTQRLVQKAEDEDESNINGKEKR